MMLFFFFFQAEDGIRDKLVTGVQTCALPIYRSRRAIVTGIGDGVRPVEGEVGGARPLGGRQPIDRRPRGVDLAAQREAGGAERPAVECRGSGAVALSELDFDRVAERLDRREPFPP